MPGAFEEVGIIATIKDLQEYLSGGKKMEAANKAIVAATQQVEVASAKLAGTWTAEQQKALQLAQAQQRLADATSKSGSAHEKNSNILFKAAGAASILIGAYANYHALEGAIEKTVELGEQTYKLGLITGLSAEQASSLINVAEDLGVSYEQLSSGLRLFQRNLLVVQEAEMGFAGGTKTGEQVLQSMGIAAKDAAGDVRPLPALLENIADWFQKSADATEAAGVAQQLFGRGGAALLPVLKLGSEGLREAEASAKKLGIQLSADNVASIHKFSLAYADARDAVAGLEVQLGIKLLPQLTKAAEYLVAHQDDFAKFFNGAAKGVGTFVSDFATGWKVIEEGLSFLPEHTPEIVAAVGAIGAAMLLAFGPEAAPIVGLIAFVDLIGKLRHIAQGTLTGPETAKLTAQADRDVATHSSGQIQSQINKLQADGSKEALIAAGFLQKALDKQADSTKKADAASSHLSQVQATAAQVQDALKDKTISFAEAQELNISAEQAGRAEANKAILDGLGEGKEQAFDYAKAIASVSEAFRQGATATGQRLQLGLNQDALKGEESAASALFARPTVEVASLQLSLDKVKFAHDKLRPAIEADQEAHERAADDIQRAGDDQARAMEASAQETQDAFSRMGAAIDAEIANLQQGLTALDRTFDQADQRLADQAKIRQRQSEDEARSRAKANDAANQALQDQLDALQDRRSKVPSGKAGDSQRDSLDKQIKALQDKIEQQGRLQDQSNSQLQDYNTEQDRLQQDLQEKNDKARKKAEDELQDSIAFKEKQKAELQAQADSDAADAAAASKKLEEETRVKAGLAKDQAEADARKLKQFDAEEKVISHQIELYQDESKILQDTITLANRTLITQESQRAGAFLLASQIYITSGNVRDLSDKLGLNLIPEVDAAAALFKIANDAMGVTANTVVPNFNTAIATATASILNSANTLNQGIAHAFDRGFAPPGSGEPTNTGIPSPNFKPKGFALGGFTPEGGPTIVQVHPNEVILPMGDPRRSREIFASLPPGFAQAVTGKQAGVPPITISVQGGTLEQMRQVALDAVYRAFREAETNASQSGALLTTGLG